MAVTYTKVHDSRPVNFGGVNGSGDYTSASFTVGASKLLLLIVSLSTGGGGTWTLPLEIPTPITSGLTWIKKIGAHLGSTGSQPNGSTEMWLADSGAGGTITVSQSGAGTQWDSMVSALDVSVYEITGAQIAALQNGVTAIGAQMGASVDPGAQSIDLSGPPASGSYVFASAAMFSAATGGVTPGSDFTEVAERIAGTSGPYLLSEVQVRTASTSTTVSWVDLQSGAADVQSWALCACEILAAGATSPPGTMVALTGYGSTANSIASLLTPVFRPPPDSLLLVFTEICGVPPASLAYTFTGGGLTYNPITVSPGTHTFGSSFNNHYALHSAVVGSSPSEMQITFDPFNDATTNPLIIGVCAIIGSPIIVQSANASVASTTSSQTVTLPANAVNGHTVLAMFGGNNDTPLSTASVPTDGGTWLNVFNPRGFAYAFLAIFAKRDFTGTSVTCTTVATTIGGSRGGVAVELYVPPPPPSGLYIDDFNRADNTTLNGLWTDWDGGVGSTWQIVSNQAKKVGATGSDYATFASTLGMPDMFVEADYDRSLGAYCVVNARRPSALNVETGYLGYIDPGGGACHIAKVVAGTFSGISGGDFSAGAPYPATGRIRLECLGTLLTLKINGVTIGSVNDSTITGGNYAGINGSDQAILDNFAIGGLGVSGPSFTLVPLVSVPLMPMGG